jgi:DNA-binding winged helix-turn-helix (wHTH) protein/tetratricopeptide (TPR) repeat protein
MEKPGRTGRTIHRFGDCELDEGRYELRRGGVPRHLEPQVFEVLAYLVRHRGRVVTKAELLDQVWGSRFVSESALTSRVKAARKAVGDSGREQRVIRTVHGRGYEFLAPVRAVDGRERTPSGSAPPVLPGRGAELGRLAGLLELAAAGRPQVAFVTGEPGIGKTTLVEAFAGWAGGGGRATVARGQCLEHRGPPEPYLPVFDALTRLGRQDGGGVVELLGRVAPTWLVELPALLRAEDRAAVERRALGGTRERMLREVAEALEAMAADRPLVLHLEDLHWADPSTVDLVEWLARRDTAARLLLVGTYRPADARAAGHPIDAAAAELLLRGRAAELRLGELDTDAVRAVLEQRLDGAEVPEELARTVRRRTDGVPLFVAQLAQSWVESGVLRAAAGRWELARPGGADPDVPGDLRRLIELQLAKLDPADLTILEVSAVAGMAFAAATAAAGTAEPTEEVERRCATLAGQGRFLRASDPVDWPDGTVSAGFAFAHDLHRTVLYDRIPAGRRARLHAAVADRLERAYGPAAAGHVTELATHFLHGREDARAVPYLQSAAEQALGRSAQLEAIQHLGALLQAVERLPEGPDRDRAELRARMTLGPALIATDGFASPAVEGAFLRARELCGRLGDPPELPLVLHGLAAVNEFRGRYHVSEEILQQLLGAGDSPLAVEAHELLACSTFHQGKAATAVRYAEAGLALYDEDRDSGYLAPYGEHPAVACHDWAALALWFLGRPDSAMAHAEAALALAREHPYSLATAEVQLTYLHQYRGEPDQTLRRARQAAATATAHGFPIRAAQAAILGGWARAAAGDGDGPAELRAGLDAYLATGAELDHPYYLGLLGDAVGRTAPAEAGLAVLEEAIELVGTARPFYYLPELHRLRGDLLARDGRAAVAAEAYRRAMEIAAGHGTRSAELRAVVALCRLPDRARPPQALAELRRLYGQFEEGFATPDLVAARALLGRS